MSSFSSPILSATQFKNLAYGKSIDQSGFALASTSSSYSSSLASGELHPSKLRPFKPDTDEGFLEEGDLVGCNGSPTRSTTDSTKRSAVLELRYKDKALAEASSSFPGEVANSWIKLDGYFSRCENGTSFSEVSYHLTLSQRYTESAEVRGRSKGFDGVLVNSSYSNRLIEGFQPLIIVSHQMAYGVV
jgi:hypothetical protein